MVDACEVLYGRRRALCMGLRWCWYAGGGVRGVDCGLCGECCCW